MRAAAASTLCRILPPSVEAMLCGEPMRFGAGAFVGTQNALWGSYALWGSNALWGASGPDAFNALWGSNALWGATITNATQSLSVDVDGEN